MANTVKLGVLLPTRHLIMTAPNPQNIKPIITMAREVEKAGLDSVWVGDSLTAKPRLEPLTALAAVASNTEHVRLGTSVLLAALRHPVTLSHVLGTLDVISGGRLIIGAGVGGVFNEDQRQEWRNAGVDPKRRASRFEEVVDITKRLTAGEVVAYSGDHFQLESLKVRPTALQGKGVPFLMAAHWHSGSESQFARSARLGDGIISISDHPNEYRLLLDRIEWHAEQLGRDFAAMERTFYMTVNIATNKVHAEREANRFLQAYYGLNYWGDRWGPYGTSESVIERINHYVENSAETIIVRFAAMEQESQLELFLNKVEPAFL